MAIRAIAALLLVLAVSIPVGAWPPESGGWSDVSAATGLSHVSGRTVAVADWDGDKNVDIIVTPPVGDAILVYAWSSGGNTFSLVLNISVVDVVVSVVTADFNRDGNIDAAIATASGALYILSGPTGPLYPAAPGTALHPTVPALNALNLFGNCALIDLTAAGADGALLVLRNALYKDANNCDFVGGNATFSEYSRTPLPSALLAASTGAVDFAGTCMPSFLAPSAASNASVSLFEVSPTPGAAPWLRFTVPSSFGVISFGDVNGDGATDAFFAACATPRSGVCDVFDSIAVLYNDLGGANPCSESSCCAGHPTSFASVFWDGTTYTADGPFQLVPLDCDGAQPAGSADTRAAFLHTLAYPALARLLDYDRDTRGDFVVPTTWGPLILTNGGGYFTCGPLDAGRAARDGDAFRATIPFPFDIDEDGQMDLLGFSINATAAVPQYGYWNGNPSDEQYFFTATMLNGVKGASFPAWGAIQIGAVHRFQWQDVDTHVRSAAVTQMPSSSATALHFPHAHFGLGQTFSYIQNYATGVRVLAAEHSRLWSAYLMPNSQVVVVASPITDPTAWTIRLFLYPLRFKELLLIALPTVLALIGIPIAVLKYREVRADRAEKRQMLS